MSEPHAEQQGCFPESIELAAQKLKVLGHPVRLKLLCLIQKQDDSCVGELYTCLNQPQPVVSQHLAVLKENGIVKSEIKGNKRIYSIIDPFVVSLMINLEKLNKE
jgi:DNA-binding transcriptional ArsR family regulator